MPDIGLVLLAAGEARRMGSPKQLLEVEGVPMLRRAAEAALMSRCAPVVVVCGAASGRVRKVLAGVRVDVVENPFWERGIGTSIRAGITALAGRDVDAAIVAAADQPLVGSATFARLVGTYREGGVSIVASEYSGTVGVPALFDRSVFPALLALEPDQGCKGLILRYAGHSGCGRGLLSRVSCPEASFDVDTPADYRRLLDGRFASTWPSELGSRGRPYSQ